MADSSIAALNSLLRNADIEDHEEALSLAASAVKASKPGSPEQLTAYHTKIVALLKLDRFEDALRVVSDAGSQIEELCTLESGYALYKTGQLAEVGARYPSALRNAKDLDQARALSHLAAQAAYRAENFSLAAEIYGDRLLAEGRAEQWGEENDLRINLQAAYAQLEWQGNGYLVPDSRRQPGREEMEAFEAAYNAACGCIARGDLVRAAILLKRAKDLCEASEDLNDDERRLELVPIIVQQAYVSAKLGKLEDATSLQNSVKILE